MNHYITKAELLSALDSQKLAYTELELQNGCSFICSQRGGRLLGPFLPDGSESLLWLNAAYRNKDDFAAFLASGDWNLGGDRLWFFPEMPFFVQERRNFYDTYVVQPALDPGNYTVSHTKDGVCMAQEVTLPTFENNGVVKEFSVSRSVFPAKDPLSGSADYASLTEQVTYCGIRQEIRTSVKDRDTTTYLESWLLSQVNPAGELIVPTTTAPEYVDYYEPVPPHLVRKDEKHLYFTVTGDRRYKVGVSSCLLTGRSGYLGTLRDGRRYLFVRRYENDPSNIYCADGFDQPALRGNSLFLYNGHSEHGFAEFEHSGRTISGDTGIREHTDACNYWFYVGTEEKLRRIAEILIG